MGHLPQSQQHNTALTTPGRSLTVAKALRNWQTSPEQYYVNLPVPSTSRKLATVEAPTLGELKKNLGTPGIRAILVLAVSEVVFFFNVGKNMDDSQAAFTADLIIEEFSHLTVEEIKHCLRKAMKTAKVFDRLDGNLILGWIREYDCERDEIMIQLNIEEKNRRENAPPAPSADGISYKEYVAGVRARAEAGDKTAKEQLETIEMIDARRKVSPDAEFKRWYYTEYIPKSTTNKQ